MPHMHTVNVTLYADNTLSTVNFTVIFVIDYYYLEYCWHVWGSLLVEPILVRDPGKTWITIMNAEVMATVQ